MSEVDLRTLSSDIQSIEHGSPAPIPESIKVAADQPAEGEAPAPAKPPSKAGKTIFMVLLLIGMAAIFYFYVYPALVASFSPQTH